MQKNKYQKSIVYAIIKRKNIRLERRDKMNYLYDVETHILVTIDTKETVNNLYNNLQRVFRRFLGVTVKLQKYYKSLDLMIGIQKIM